MPFRFRKSIKLGKGVKFNLSKSGVSTSFGRKGASVNFSKRGVQTTASIPGTGLSYSSLTGSPKQNRTTTRSIQHGSAGNQSGGCLNSLFNLIAFPLGIIFDLIKSIFNPETRKSSLILTGSVVGICMVLYAGMSALGGAGTASAPTSSPVPTIPVMLTNTTLPTLTLTATATKVFPTVSVEDYPRMATTKFELLRDMVIEMANIHNQYTGDHELSKDKKWYAHASTTLEFILIGSQELASMKNYPSEYSDFYQQMQSMAGEADLLYTNYMVALGENDAGALDQAQANLGNVITFINQGYADISLLPALITQTPAITSVPTKKPLPTATLVVVYPTAPAVSAVCSCSSNLYNCSKADFSSKSAAQACYNYCLSLGAGDIHDLDRDNDGEACDSGLK